MRNHPLSFLLGFAVGYLPVLHLLANVNLNPPMAPPEKSSEIVVVLETLPPADSGGSQVLAAAADSLKTEEPGSSVAPTETPKATVKATPSPTPTTKPTALPTQTPEITPTPVPTTPDVWAPEPYNSWIEQYAAEYSIDRNLLDRIAQCESQFIPTVVSPNGDYVGLFQFSTGTWQKYRGPEHMNLDPNPDLRSNPEESIKTAAYLIKQSGTNHWPACLR